MPARRLSAALGSCHQKPSSPCSTAQMAISWSSHALVARLEVGPCFQIHGYPAGIPGRVPPVRRVGSELKTCGFSEPAGNCVVGNRVPRYPQVFGYPRVMGIPGSSCPDQPKPTLTNKLNVSHLKPHNSPLQHPTPPPKGLRKCSVFMFATVYLGQGLFARHVVSPTKQNQAVPPADSFFRDAEVSRQPGG